MGFNDITDRSSPGGGALVPPEHTSAIFKEAENTSAALRLMRRMPVLTNQKSFPVMAGLPTAFWIDHTANPQDDKGLIQTTEMAWKNVTMNVADIAVIAPFPRRVAEDIKAGGINLTEEMRPSLAAAIARAIDAAIFFGTNKPVVWPDAVAVAAANAGNSRTIQADSSEGGLHSDIIHLMRTVRGDGFMVNAGIARPTFEFDLINSRDTTGQPLFRTPEVGALGSNGSVLGRPVTFATDGVFPAQDPDNSDVELIMFDAQKHIIGIREELSMSVHSESVIQDNTGAIMYNLFQQDLMAVKVVARIGYAVANTVTVAQPVEGNRYPGGILVTAAENP